MLSDTPIDKIQTKCRKDFSKEICCTEVEKGVEGWLEISQSKGNKFDCAVCTFLGMSKNQKHYTFSELTSHLMDTLDDTHHLEGI